MTVMALLIAGLLITGLLITKSDASAQDGPDKKVAAPYSKLAVAPLSVTLKAINLSKGQTPTSRQITLSNPGTETLHVTVHSPSAPFVISSGGGQVTIPAKAKSEVVVAFAPAVKGAYKSAVSITSDATKGKDSVNVTVKASATGATPVPPPTPTPTATPTPTSDARIFVYLANYATPDPDCSVSKDTNSISGYSANTITGVLTPIPGSPFTYTGCSPVNPVADPTGRFLYVPDLGNNPTYLNTIEAFTINPSSGALTPIPGAPFGNVPEASGLAMDPTGKLLYASNYSSNGIDDPGAVSVFTINPANGALTQTTAKGIPAGSTGIQTNAVAIDPVASFLYAANQGSDDVSAFSIDKTTGDLTALTGSPFAAAPGFASYVTVDPTGNFVYATNASGSGDGLITGWNLNSISGNLTPITGSPFASDDYPYGLAVHPKLPVLYVANEGSATGAVSAYKINETTGALSEIAGSPFDAGLQTNDVAIDATGKFLFASNAVDGSVSAFTIDQTTGALTAVAGSPFTDGYYLNPIGVAVVNTIAP